MAQALLPGIHRATSDDLGRVVDVWERAVRATHHFLTEADIEYFKPLVWQELADVHLDCVRDARGDVVGFMAVADDKIEALFVDPAWHRQGIGRRLVTYAVEDRAATRADVNEQNQLAVAFYARMGFRVEGRSQVDATGRPFPLLHLRYRKPHLRELPRAQHISVRAMRETVEALEALLDEMCTGVVPGDTYSLRDLESLCRSLVERQSPDGEWAGLWYVGPDACDEDDLRQRMSEYGSSDFFKDFVARPSDAAVALLTRTLLDHPLVAAQIPRYVDALHTALAATRINRDLLSRRGLHALDILNKGGVFEYLIRMSHVAPQLVDTRQQILDDAMSAREGALDGLYQHVRSVHLGVERPDHVPRVVVHDNLH